MKLRIKKDAHCVINYSISFLYSKNFWKNSQWIAVYRLSKQIID